MSSWTLGDEEVQASISHFLTEAHICSRQKHGGGVLGFAAMSTVFPCVLAVGEALKGSTAAPSELVANFLVEMKDRRSWLLPPEGVRHSDVKTVTILEGIRNGFAHALAAPFDVTLCHNRQMALHADREKWRLMVPDFVDAVKATIVSLSQSQPSLSWQKVMRVGRGPVGVTELAWNTLGVSEMGRASGSGP